MVFLCYTRVEELGYADFLSIIYVFSTPSSGTWALDRAKEQALGHSLEYTVSETIRRREIMKHSVTKAQVRRWIGKNIVVTKKDGTFVTGKLVRISGNRIILQRDSGKKVQTKAIIPLVLFDLLAIGTAPYVTGGFGYGGFGGHNVVPNTVQNTVTPGYGNYGTGYQGGYPHYGGFF